jgi:GST-like protein
MITLYSSATGNGYRAAIMLEETGLPYAVEAIDLQAGDNRKPEFLAISPLGKIPAIVDPDTADGTPVSLCGTLAIALYLAEKTGMLLPANPVERARAWQWSAIIASDFGAAVPGIFFAKRLGEAAHAGIIAKYHADLDTYFQAMDLDLQIHPYLAGSSYSIADVLAAPLVLVTAGRFGIALDRFSAITRWRDEIAQRPAVAKGMTVPA